ncbi:MAG: DNA repair protein RecO [Crocinitomicaceae bacterium]|nr:DNA repair protein RecO [Crocinitomicaceae bacterium]
MKDTDHAIFLHRTHYSESSLITTFYTKKNGIQKFIFQGGKKKSVGIFPLALSEIQYYHRPDSELGKLTATSPLKMLHELSTNPIKSTLAYFIADVLRNCLKTDQKDIHLFTFLENRIELLSLTTDLSLFNTQFLIDFTYHLGIEPILSTTVKTYFYLQDGSFSDTYRIGEIVAKNDGVLLIQALFLKEKIDINFSKQAKKEAFEIMLSYYKLHLPSFDTSNSIEIIREILYD